VDISLDRYIDHHPIVPYIRLAGYAVRNPWYVPERKLLDYLLVYIQEGQCLFEVDGIPYAVSSGEVCLIQPNVLLTLRGISNTITPFAHLDLFYNPDREQSFPTKPGQLDLSAYSHLLQPKLNDFTDMNIPVIIHPKSPQQFKGLLLKMIGHWLSDNPYSMYEAQTAANELFWEIIKVYGETNAPIHSAPQELNWITSYFSFHLSDSITVQDMAKRANLSTSRFSKLFRKNFGMPPYQYLLHLRLKHAEELLLTSHLKLYQIADYCGFANEQHFSKAYRQKFGISPGSVRGKE